MNTLQKYEKWLGYGIIAGVFALLLMPFVITKSLYFPYVAGKGFYFRIIIEIISVLYIVLASINTKYRPKSHITLWVIGGLLVSFLISNLLGPNPYKSFLSNFERMDGYINLVHLVLLFVITSRVFTEKIWFRFWNSSLVAAFAIDMYVFMQLAGSIAINQGGVRVDGPFGNATYLAVYALLHIGIALYLMARRDMNKFMRVVYGLSAVLNLIVLYYTATRGAVLGLIAGLVGAPILVALFNREKQMIKIAGAIVGLGLIAIVGFMSVKSSDFVLSNPVLSRFASISLSDATTQSRFQIWNMAWEGVKENPVFGWGQENFNYVFNTYYEPSMWNQEQWFDRTHNVVLDWFVTGGVVGGALYLALFVIALWFIIKREDFEVLEKVALIGLVVSYGFQNLFVFDNPVSYVYWFLILAFIAGRNLTADEDVRGVEVAESHNKTAAQVIVVVSVLAVVYASYVFSVKPIIASQNLITGLQSYNKFQSYGQLATSIQRSPGGNELTRGHIPQVLKNNIPDDVKRILSLFKSGNANDKLVDILSDARVGVAMNIQRDLEKVIELGTFATPEAREQIANLSGQIYSNSAFPPEIKSSFISFARGQLVGQSESAPLDARRQYLAGSGFRQINDFDQAIIYLNKAVELSPKKQTIILELALAQLQKKDAPAMLSSTQKAYELDTSFPNAKMMYGGALIYNGNSEAGHALLDELIAQGGENERMVYTSGVITNILAEVGDYEALIDSWSYRVAQDPSNINNRISLAASYYEKGERVKAIETIEKAIEINPDFREYGEQYIADMRAGRRPQ